MIKSFSDFRCIDPFRIEIFSIKVERYEKSRQILDDILLSQIFGGRRSKNCTHVITHLCLAARRLEKFREDTPTSPDVIDSNTVNFRPHFKISRLKLGDPVPHGVCASKPRSIFSACENLRAQHPLRAEI